MAMERTFAMLKPGVVQRRLVGEILARLEKKGLDLVALRMMRLDGDLARRHYRALAGKPFFGELLAFMTSGPVIAMVLQGDDAISMLRRICGATTVEEALPGTIRGDFADHTGKNVIHASDSPESAGREIGLFFRPEEILQWEDGNDEWI